MVNRISRNDNLIVKRGDVFYANLVGYGCVQGGLRPVVIISNDINNKFSNIVQIVPLTSQLKKCDLPVHVYISEIKGVLTKDSYWHLLNKYKQLISHLWKVRKEVCQQTSLIKYVQLFVFNLDLQHNLKTLSTAWREFFYDYKKHPSNNRRV